MLDNFSMRARQIIFAARFKAGERGANMIDTGDLLIGLVLEDQGILETIIFSTIFEGQGTSVNQAKFHVPFFSSKVAEDLLASLQKKLPKSRPVALTTEVPLSPSLERIFDSAKAVQTRFQHSQVEPLHLLAAILTEEASQSVKLLQDSGITQEKVLLTLSGATEN
jgi:ATP-dependent Clp protease ATP-binding subunit ClpA